MRPLIIASICVLGCLIIVATLYTNVSEKEILYENGFQRDFKSSVLLNEQFVNLGYNSYYIAGLSNVSVFLANYRVPTFYLKINYSLTDTARVPLTIPDEDKLAWNVLNIVINSPDLYIADRLTPILFYGTLPNPKFTKSNLNGVRFGKMVPVSPNHIIVRTYDPIHGQNVLKTTTMDSSNNPLPTYVLEKQVDGMFCTDGFFLHNQAHGEVLYVYYYRNQYVGLNSMLDVVYKGNTIDTVSQAKVQIGTIASENKETLVKRPDVVNKRGAVYKDQLYIHSGLIADNESIEAFKSSAVIDVYSLDDQSYQYSFYIPNFKKKRLREFHVNDNKLVAIYSNYLVTYELNDVMEEEVVTVQWSKKD